MANSTNKDIDIAKIYKPLVYLVLSTCLFVFVIHLYLGNYSEVIMASASIAIALLSIFTNNVLKKPYLSYHILLIGLLITMTSRIFFAFPILSYLMFYPVTLFFIFYLFKEYKTRLFYTILIALLGTTYVVMLISLPLEQLQKLSYSLEISTIATAIILTFIFAKGIINQLKNSESEKDQSIKVFKAIIDNAPIGIALLNHNLDGIYTSLSTSKIFGYTDRDAFESNPIESYTSNISRSELKEYREQLINNPENVIQKRFKSQKSDGNPITIEATMVYIKGITWKDSKILVMIKNISEQVLHEQKVQEKNNELQKYIESNIKLENFAYIASHDLKTPLQTILNFGNLLQNSNNTSLNDKEKKYIDFIVDSSMRLNNIINDMLNYSIIGTTGKEQFVDLNKIVEDIKADLSPKLEEKAAVIESVSLPTIWANEVEIISLFQNIFTNALKYSKENIPPKIKVNCKENNAEWIFSIKDNGIGFNPKYENRIFSMFQRLVSSKNIEGTGIGLAQCKKIIELYKGKIWAKSVPDEGSVFYFSIPKTNKL